MKIIAFTPKTKLRKHLIDKEIEKADYSQNDFLIIRRNYEIKPKVHIQISEQALLQPSSFLFLEGHRKACFGMVLDVILCLQLH